VRPLPAATAAAVLFFASCFDATEPLPVDSVLATSEVGAIALTNQSSARVFYFVYEREGAALINWAPCVDPSRCASLGPDERVVIPNTAIGGYAPGKAEAIVWWWHGPPPPGLDDIHAIVVSLQAS
jgi:hypothetical protein